MKLGHLLGIISIPSMLFFAYESQAQEIVELSKINNRTINSIAWSPNGDFLAASDANEILVIDIDTQKIVTSIPASSYSIAWNRVYDFRACETPKAVKLRDTFPI